MATYDLGTARGEVVLDFDQTGIDKANTEVSKFGSGFKKTAAVAVGAVGLIGGAVTGLILKGGLSRALNIQDAQEKLRGLGHDTKSITTIMDSALQSVKGTAFGLDEAATTAATAVAAGIKPGKELTKYLKLTADTATIAGSSLGEVGSILNQATSSGVVFTDTLNQLSDRGIPVFPYLQKELKLSGAELRKFVSDGDLDVKTLMKVLNENLAGSALASGNTTRGALKNVGAAFSRLGAQVVSGPVQAAPKLFQTLAGTVDRFAAALGPATAGLGALVTKGMERLTVYLENVKFDGLVKGLQAVTTYIKGVISAVQTGGAQNGLAGFLGALGAAGAASVPALKAVQAQIGPLASSFGEVIASGVQLLPGVFNALAKVLQFLADHTGVLTAAIGLLVGAYILQKAAIAATLPKLALETALKLGQIQASRANTAATLGSLNARRLEAGLQKTSILQLGIENGLLNLRAARLYAVAAASKVAAVATGLFSGAVGRSIAALKLFALALVSTGIGAVVVILGTLAAALIYFFTQTKAGQTAWANFTRFLGEAWNNVVKVIGDGAKQIQAFLGSDLGKQLVPFIALISPLVGIPLLIIQNWSSITAFFQGLFAQITGFARNFVQGFNDTWTGIIGAVQPAIDFFTSSVLPVLLGVKDQVVAAYQTFAAGVGDAFSTVAGIVGGVVTFFQTNVGPVLATVFDTVKGAITTAVGAIQAAWAQILPIIQPALDYLANTVLPVIVPLFEKFGYAIGVVAAIIVALPLALLVAGFIGVAAVLVGIVIAGAKVIEFFAGLAGAIAGGVTAIAGVIGSIFTGIVTAVQTFIAGVVAAWNGLIAFFVGIGTAIGAALAPFVSYFQTTVAPVFVAAAGTIQAAVALIQRAVSYGFQLVLSIVQTVLGAVGAFIASVWNGIVGTITSAVNRVSAVVRTVFGAVVAFVSTVVNGIRTAFVTGFNAVVSVVGGAIGRVVAAIRTALAPIVAFVAGIINRVRAAFTTGFNAVVGVVTGAVSRVVGAVRSGLQPIIAAATSILNGFKRAIQSGIQTAVAFFSGIRARVIGFFAGAGTWLYNAGKEVLTGFLNGLKSMFDSITGFLGQVTAAIPKHKGPPAKDKVLLYNSGVLIMQGLQNGLGEGADAMLAYLDGVTTKIKDAATGRFAEVAEALTSSVADALKKGTAGDIAGALQGLYDKVNSAVNDTQGALTDAKAKLAADNKAVSKAAAEAKKAKGKAVKAAQERLAAARKQVADDKKAIKDLGKAVTDKQQTALDKVIKDSNDRLQKLAEARDAIVAQLAEAQKNLESAITTRDDYKTSVSAAVASLGNIVKSFNAAQSEIDTAAGSIDDYTTKISDLDSKLADAADDRAAVLANIAKYQQVLNSRSASLGTKNSAQNQLDSLNRQLAALDKKVLTYNATRADLATNLSNAQNKSGQSPVQAIIDNLRNDVAAANEFNSIVAQLKAAGLDDTSYKQLVDDFASNGSIDPAKRLLASGPESIRQIAALQSQLKAAADALGTSTSNSLYQAGVDAAQGIVDGLKAQQTALEDQMTVIGEAMITAIKKSLGIKSPSKVGRKEVGQPTGEGVGLGIMDMRSYVEKQARGLLDMSGMGRGDLIAAKMGVATSSIGAVRAGAGAGATVNKTMNYYAAPGTQQLSAEDSLFDSMRKARTVAGW